MSSPWSFDTDPHPTFEMYSAGNFAEVAPERLSIMSWSLLGDPVERAVRALISRLWPHARWHTGSHYTFVGYFSCRPYHNLSAMCHATAQVPGIRATDLTSCYFEDAQPPDGPPGLDINLVSRTLAIPRLVHELVTLRRRATLLEGEIAGVEYGLRAADTPLAIGQALAAARKTLDAAWSLHYTTTMSLIPARVLQRALGRLIVPNWDELEPWLASPAELPWTALHDADGLLTSADFLRRAFYEIADDHEPWRDYSRCVPQIAHSGEHARRLPSPADVAWSIFPRAKAALLPQIARAISDTMACREQTKSLAMRVLHGFRALVPRIAALAGLDEDAWPYLTLDELTGAHRPGQLSALAAERRRECVDALAQPAPELIASADNRSPEQPSARRGRGVSPGIATGIVIHPGAGAIERIRRGEEPKILVCESADADIQPLLPHVAGVITGRGSLLSHVSILVRERQIPAVVGHALAFELAAGQHVSIDGTKGEVTLIDYH